MCSRSSFQIHDNRSFQDEEVPGKFVSTLFGHTKRVNAVKWINNLNGSFQNSFVSASVDTTAIVWIREQENYIPKYVLKGILFSYCILYRVSGKGVL